MSTAPSGTGLDIQVNHVFCALDGDPTSAATVRAHASDWDWDIIAPKVLRARPDAAAALRALLEEPRRAGRAQGVPEYAPLLAPESDILLGRKLEPIDAVPVPFPSWAVVCRDEGGGEGLARGWHVILAARTGVGKSVVSLNAAHIAVGAGHVVYFASLEMSQTQLWTRFLAIASGQPIHKLEQGPHLDTGAHRAAGRLVHGLHEETGGLFLSNQRQLSDLGQVEAAIRHAVECEGARLAIVDYLQLCARDPNDPGEVTKASHTIRRLAQDLNVTTLCLSQFNRETSKLDAKPSVHGLMGGSAIENDSDQVLLIDHSRMQRAPLPAEGWHSFATLAKNRHGPTVDIPIAFDSRTLRMREQMPDELPAMRVA
jgi:KaiC/GvpD/RAD55 family RecA-like ATPase